MRIQLLALLSGLLLAPGATIAEEPMAGERNTDARHCVPLNRIDHTDVVDDENILFYMNDRSIYLNRLPHRCPGLGFDQRFMYRTSINQLCNVDIITVLDDIGFGFSPGPSCGLGMFHPISEDQARQMKEAAKRR